MVLADAEQLQSGDHSQDFVALKLLSLIGELRDEQSHTWRSRGPERRPLALVLTKADKCDGLYDNPREFAEGHAAALWNDCRDAVSAARGVRVFGRRRNGLCVKVMADGNRCRCELSREESSSRSAG